MNELINNLKSNTELMEKMGLEWFEPSKCMFIEDVPIDFEEDDYFGSATFVVRALKVLRRYEGEKKFRPGLFASWPESPACMFNLCNLAGDDEFYDAPTMVQACAYALVACFGGEK